MSSLFETCVTYLSFLRVLISLFPDRFAFSTLIQYFVEVFITILFSLSIEKCYQRFFDCIFKQPNACFLVSEYFHKKHCHLEDFFVIQISIFGDVHVHLRGCWKRTLDKIAGVWNQA